MTVTPSIYVYRSIHPTRFHTYICPPQTTQDVSRRLI